MNTTPKDAPNIFGRFCLLGANMEQWRDAPGYEGLYLVSDLGRVKTCATGRIKAQVFAGKYLQACLSKNGKAINKSVHRLVALAFIPNPDGKPEVNHIDGNKANNTASNLEWVTSSGNKLHAYATGLNVHYTRRVRRSDGEVFPSIKAAAHAIGGTKGNICTACRTGGNAYGYQWEYMKEGN